MVRIGLILLVIFAGVGAWVTDFVSMEGERTIYTASCDAGVWDGARCTGKLMAGERHKFRALKAHREVLFWIAGSSMPSSKFTSCDIRDARNWTCEPCPEMSKTIARVMSQGSPIPEPNGKTVAFHPVSKFKWMLLKSGLSFGNQADA